MGHFILIMALLILVMAAGVSSVMAINPGPQQNLFEADLGTGNINEFTPSGAQSTFATGIIGAGPLAFDNAGNLYVGHDGIITEITPGGMQSTFASLPFQESPFGLAFNNAGNLLVVNHSGTVFEITPDGVQSTFVTGLNGSPNTLAFNSAGDLFVTFFIGAKIDEIAPDGTVSVFATGTGTKGPLAFDSEGDLFSAVGSDLYEFINNNGTLSSTPVLFSSAINGPTTLAFDSAGDLFESDSGNNDINEFINNDGILSSTPVVFASGLNGPNGLAFQGIALPVPEPSILALLAVGSTALLFRRRKN